MIDGMIEGAGKLFAALNAVGLVALIGLILRHRAAMRKLAIDESEVDRKSLHDLIAILNGQVETLGKQVQGLTRENDVLRKEIRELHTVIDGMRRENQAAQIHGQRAITEVLSALPQGPVVPNPGRPLPSQEDEI